MYIIGENIHIISPAVKEALKNRDREYFMEAAIKQVEAGAQCVDLNLGPRKKIGKKFSPGWLKPLKPWWMCPYASIQPMYSAWKPH